MNDVTNHLDSNRPDNYQEQQCESEPLRALEHAIGYKRHHTTSYHPCLIGLVGSCHRQSSCCVAKI